MQTLFGHHLLNPLYLLDGRIDSSLMLEITPLKINKV
jgi:hypothetical protein